MVGSSIRAETFGKPPRADPAGQPLRGLKRLSVFVLTMLMLIPMQVGVGDGVIGIALLTIGLLALRYFLGLLGQDRPFTAEHLLFGLLFVLMTYFLGLAALGQVHDLSMVVMCVYGALMYAAALSLVRLYRSVFGTRYIEEGLKCIFWVGFVHAILQISVLLFEPVSQAVYSVVLLSEDSATHIRQGYRSPGLFSSGAAILGTFNAQVLIIGWVAFLRTPQRASVARLLAMALVSVVLVAAIAVSGRTGFVVLSLCLLVISCYQLLLDPSSRLVRNLVLVCVMIASLVVLVVIRFGTEGIEQNLRWSFEFIYSLMEGDGLKTASTSILFDEMFFLPGDIQSIIFGTTNFGRSPSLPYINSDAGYVLMLFGAGLVGIILTMSVFVYMLAMTVDSTRHDLVMLLVAFILTIFVINTKDFYFLQNSGVTQIIMMCFALLMAARADRFAGLAKGRHGTARPRCP